MVQYVKISLAVVLVSIFCVLYVDQAMTAFFMPDELYYFRRVSRYLTDVGEGGLWFAVSLVAIAYGYRQRLEKWRVFGLQFLFSLIVSGLFLQMMKFLIGRQRPHVSDDYHPHMFYNFNTNPHFHSMPSGHSQVLFTAAVNFALLFPRQAKWIYAAAFFFAMTRVFTTQHFFSDVLMGCLVGYLGATFTLYLMARRQKGLEKSPHLSN